MNSKIVFKSDLFDIEEEKITYPSGRKSTHHNVLRLPTASVFPLDQDYQLHLVSEFRALYNKRVLQSVAGFIEPDENILATAKRELKEEAGITAKKWRDLGFFYLAGSVIKGKTHLFLAHDLEIGVQNTEEGEDIKVVKLTLDEAVEKVMSGEINTASTVIGILKLDKMRQRGEI